MKECITSDKVKGGKKNWRVRYNQNEKCGSLKSLVCAARSFFASVSEKFLEKKIRLIFKSAQNRDVLLYLATSARIRRTGKYR